MQTTYKAYNNKKTGVHIAIPKEAYINAGEPKEYTVCVMQDGTLVYQPVHP